MKINFTRAVEVFEIPKTTWYRAKDEGKIVPDDDGMVDVLHLAAYKERRGEQLNEVAQSLVDQAREVRPGASVGDAQRGVELEPEAAVSKPRQIAEAASTALRKARAMISSTELTQDWEAVPSKTAAITECLQADGWHNHCARIWTEAPQPNGRCAVQFILRHEDGYGGDRSSWRERLHYADPLAAAQAINRLQQAAEEAWLRAKTGNPLMIIASAAAATGAVEVETLPPLIYNRGTNINMGSIGCG